MLQLFVAWLGSAHAESPTVLKVWHAYRDAKRMFWKASYKTMTTLTQKSLLKFYPLPMMHTETN